MTSAKQADAASGWMRRLLATLTSPFTTKVPIALQNGLLALQSQRLEAVIPLICLSVIANSLAMAIAVAGDLPLWQQIGPPALIVIGAVAVLAYSRWRGPPGNAAQARRQLSDTLVLAIAQGLIAGFWCVNAFTETERYYCMVAPVFIGIAALINASCLMSVPRAAVAGIVATLLPIIVKMMLYDNVGVRAMAVMMIVVGVTQGILVLAKFRETVATFVLQDELNRLALSDPLTGLSNRLAFRRTLDACLAQNDTVLIAMADLDGFKLANDTHGHHAGDEVLIGVAGRMKSLAVTARLIARLGGDEFVLLYVLASDSEQAMAEIRAIRAAVALPFAYGAAHIGISTCIGIATNPDDGAEAEVLLRAADGRLYQEKARRRLGLPSADAAASQERYGGPGAAFSACPLPVAR